MSDSHLTTAYYSQGPMILIIGCGDMGMGCARVLAVRAPLLLVDIDQVRLKESIDQLRSEGYQVDGQVCDITDEVQIQQLSERLAKTSGVRVLVHVAAVANSSLDWKTIVDINLLGAHRVVRMVTPHFIQGGVALLVSSAGSQFCPKNPKLLTLLDDPFQNNFYDKLAAEFGSEPDFFNAYFMSKQGVNRLAQQMAVELGDKAVRALSISPGLIDSTMGRTGGEKAPIYDGSGKKKLGTREDKAIREIPLKRQGTVLEIIAVIRFLASDEASFVNGIDILVDGGATAMWQTGRVKK